MKTIVLALLVAALGLSACGRKGKLERVDPDAPVQTERDRPPSPLDALRDRGGI